MSALFDESQYVVGPSLADRFLIPPFSALVSRQGLWQERRREWGEFMPDDERGRDHMEFWTSSTPEFAAAYAKGPGVSVFDPVLAELAYRWWAPPGGSVFDPFAGGPARGMVASTLGLHYTGVDLSLTQVEANRAVAESKTAEQRPRWVHGDAATYRPEQAAFDFVLSCPPYGSLERYSDDPDDMSTMKAAEFVVPYGRAIRSAVEALKPDRFATFVVGNYRENGKYVDLAGMTIRAFEEAGAEYYTEGILVKPTGTAALRTGTHFGRNRKLTRVHEYVLTFVKGDGLAAADYINSFAADESAADAEFVAEPYETGATYDGSLF